MYLRSRRVFCPIFADAGEGGGGVENGPYDAGMCKQVYYSQHNKL